DDFIQPMQKVRVQQEKNRTYSAVFHIREKKLVQLADKSVPVVVPPHHGNVALGSDDQPYRYLVAFDGNYADYFAVNLADGNRKLVRPKHHWGMPLSPSGRQAIFYDGKDWNTMSLPDGKVTTLTRNIPTRFYNEDFDSPAVPPAYGVMGWSSDE